MKNELIEEYMKDNYLDKFEKEYISEIAVRLTDGHSTMLIQQLFNCVYVAIDGEYFNMFEKRKSLDGSYQWFVLPRSKCKECI